jgi:hypothetical protein
MRACLRLARARPDPHRDEPGLLGGHERHVDARAVRQQHGHALAGREPRAHERGGERVGALGVGAPAEPRVVGRERERVGDARRMRVDDLGEGLQRRLRGGVG